MDGVLVVMSGLPGVGKSSIADVLGRELHAAVLSVDPIEAAIWRCGIPPSFETGVAAYEVAAVLAAHQLSLGLTVIVDAVSSLEVARDRWRRTATGAGTQLRVIEVVCTDEGVHRNRLGARERGIDGFPEPSWDEVQRRRTEWQPWSDERLVLDTVRPLRANVEDALSFLHHGCEPTAAQRDC